jgi:Tol biopolymer transport system component
MAIPADGNGDPVVLATGPRARGTGTISPDGKWLAYRSLDTGQWEVYLQPYPGPGARVPVSIGGGAQPVWSADGRQLYYRGLRGDSMMVATISGDDAPVVSDRTALFSANGYFRGTGPRLYHVAPDGRFLMLTQVGSLASRAARAEITVVVNWFEELRARVPNSP